MAEDWENIDIQKAKGQLLIYCPGNHDKTSCSL